jgi:hypothetical protein
MNQMTRPTARKTVRVLGESSPKLAQNCVTVELRYKAYKGAFVVVVFLEIQLQTIVKSNVYSSPFDANISFPKVAALQLES